MIPSSGFVRFSQQIQSHSWNSTKIQKAAVQKKRVLLSASDTIPSQHNSKRYRTSLALLPFRASENKSNIRCALRLSTDLVWASWIDDGRLGCGSSVDQAQRGEESKASGLEEFEVHADSSFEEAMSDDVS